MSTAVKVYPWSGSSWGTPTEFNTTEIIRADIIPFTSTINIQQVFGDEAQLFDNSQVFADGLGSVPYKLTLQIFIDSFDTKSKVETLIAHNNKLRVFYQFIKNPSAYVDVILDPNYSETYLYSGLDVSQLYTLTFYGEAR